MDRVIAYIDGFNLYYGLKTSNWKKYYWLNCYSLVEKFLKKNHELVKVKYFTAMITHPKDKKERHKIYIQALVTIPNVEIIKGKYKYDTHPCKCGQEVKVIKEKMTDTNIAVNMLRDAYQDNYDTALLVSGDSDLTPIVKAVKDISKNKQVFVVFPPNRTSFDLKENADSSANMWESSLKKSLLPNIIKKEDGYSLQKPRTWK